MISTKREDRSRRLFVCERHPAVRLEPAHELILVDAAAQLKIEVNRVHVLRVQLQCRRVDIQIQSQGFEQIVSIPSLMGAELGIIMLSDFGRRYELALLAQVVGATHTDEASFFEVIFLFKAQSDRVDEHREIMGIAADDLNEIVLPFNQGFVVDAAGVHLTEAVFASLGNEAPAIAGVLVVNLFLVFVTHRSAVDNDAGPFELGSMPMSTNLCQLSLSTQSFAPWLQDTMTLERSVISGVRL